MASAKIKGQKVAMMKVEDLRNHVKAGGKAGRKATAELLKRGKPVEEPVAEETTAAA